MDNQQLILKAEKSLLQFQGLNQNKKKIVFYAEKASDWLYFDRIISALTYRFKQDICYVSSDFQDPILTKKRIGIYPFYVGYEEARTEFLNTLQSKVAVMTIPDLGKFNVKRSQHDVHYVYVFSSLISTHMGYIKDAFDYYDSILCSGSHHVDEIKAAEKLYGLPQKILVEYGYGHLENIIEEIEQKKQKISKEIKPTHVLIAPTYGHLSLIERDDGKLCYDLIEILTKANISVTLRPHWMTIHTNSTLFNAINEKLERNKLVRVESDLSSLISLKESDIMVCDLSGIAIEYALGFLKPVVYIDVPHRIRNSDFNALDMPVFELELRSKTGEIVKPENLNSVPNIISNLLSTQNELHESLIALRNQSVFNLRESDSVGAQYLIDIIQEKIVLRQGGKSKEPVPLITAKQASVKYPNGVVGMYKNDLLFYEGDFTVLIGASGAGKSTLLRTLNNLVPLSSGTISTRDYGYLFGKKLWRFHQKRTAMIFQQHQLIGRQTALQNVLIGRIPFHSNWQCLMPWPKKDKHIALDALERVGLLGKAVERVSNLSGGEMQRVGIARAIAQEPTIILADEPVSSLDPTISENILFLFKEICEEKHITSIVSLHQVELAQKFANRILGVSNGRIVYDGTSDGLSFEILRNIYGEKYIDKPFSFENHHADNSVKQSTEMSKF